MNRLSMNRRQMLKAAAGFASIGVLEFMETACTTAQGVQSEIALLPIEAEAALAVLTITGAISPGDLVIGQSVVACLSTEGPLVLTEWNSTDSAAQKGVTIAGELDVCVNKSGLLSPAAQAVFAVVIGLAQQIITDTAAPGTTSAIVAKAKAKVVQRGRIKVDPAKLQTAYGKPWNKITEADVIAKFKTLVK